MEQIFKEIGSLSVGTVTFIGVLTGALATILAAVITAIVGKVMVTPFLSARDKQDREAEWRKHAVELAKLDLERKIKMRDSSDKTPIRPSILDFLANYRDLQELGEKSPKELYEVIRTMRISGQPSPGRTGPLSPPTEPGAPPVTGQPHGS
jgi:hypothetical protein